MWKVTGMAATLLLSAGVLMNPAGGVSAEVGDDSKRSTIHKDRVSLEASTVEDYEEVEPNDSIDAANSLAQNRWAQGHLTDKDEDYFTFEIDGDYRVEFHLSLYSMVNGSYNKEMDLDANLYDADGKKVSGYSENNNEYGYFGSFFLDPGTYYVRVVDEANLNKGIPYTLSSGVAEKYARITRYWGVDRYWTAANIARQDSSRIPSRNVVLATGQDFPDALAGAPLAEHLDAPILLTRKERLPAITEQTLSTLDAEHVTILGGTGAVSEDVEDYIKDELNLDVERISGKNRYETSVAIAGHLPASDEAVVAYGGNFPDALSIAPAAAGKAMPILLTKKESIPAATENVLNNYDQTYVVGGTGVVSDKVYRQLPNADRISGKDRYATSLAVAKYFDMETQSVGLATGSNFADALAGSVHGVKEPLLLTPKSKLDEEVKQYFIDHQTTYFQIFGGDAAVDEGVEEDIKSIYE
ncbi:cell wall-binding repeat-containing protein [Halobacillus sp. Nhm2S1]|uniref:cell wall-binding repeat-containing protein n=1 Tax=Halobacillus sp. Nhm2S1 TaxID=2866716 RepID=UPI001C73CEC4|nr:cell wall-binding repeat-containing protein [Halobacillus sp. Nhm2S1]MBX0357525.1 cell wall-binding repeat-containing protein [Halobacillus sp. Nhm2S1]